MTNDDEQLIAEALRAKAGKNAPTAQNTGPVTVSVHQTTTPQPVQPDPLHQAAAMAAAMAPTATPPPAPTPTPANPPAQATVPASPPVRPAPTIQAMHPPPPPGGLGAPRGHVPAQATAPALEQPDEADGPLAAWWILLIAVVLGLALGGMVGILTIL